MKEYLKVSIDRIKFIRVWDPDIDNSLQRLYRVSGGPGGI